jgi:glucosamine--fructose-6-phosphate aminotransferase (isomerizing)
MSPTLLENEIAEQPAVIQRLIDQEDSNVERIASTLKGAFDYVVIAARGTSDNAARYAKYLFGAHNQLQVALATPSLFTLYDKPPDFSHALVIGISQSGQSPDIAAVVKEARQQGRPTLVITNHAGSPLAKSADHNILLRAGEEKAVAATKTYTASLVSIALLSCFLGEDSENLAAIQQLPNLITQTLENLRAPMQRIERYRYMEHCAVIGRGYNYATA